MPVGVTFWAPVYLTHSTYLKHKTLPVSSAQFSSESLSWLFPQSYFRQGLYHDRAGFVCVLTLVQSSGKFFGYGKSRQLPYTSY